ncbi:hypothetical protein HY639_00225 [Candidatus Woesearchaeota archaeon]|nr:hypothetical protein [Candidatus Woesearchaeota archaeon]
MEVCKVCGDELNQSRVLCKECNTAHHEECFSFSGGCSIFGCGSREYAKLTYNPQGHVSGIEYVVAKPENLPSAPLEKMVVNETPAPQSALDRLVVAETRVQERRKRTAPPTRRQDHYKMSFEPGVMDIASFGTGFYHGFCTAQGVPVSLEFILTYGPAMVRGGLCVLQGGIVGTFVGGLLATRSASSTTALVVKGTTGAAAGLCLGGTFFGAAGATLGYCETLVGYYTGYCAGLLLK